MHAGTPCEPWQRLGIALTDQRVPPLDSPLSQGEFVAAIMMYGAITFQMLLFYCVNHPDEDMRKYSWCNPEYP